jgi:hypothetical protein
MSALPGIIGLLLFIYIRPQELSSALGGYNLLHFWLALAVLGAGRDVWRGRARLVAAPMHPYVMAFWAWCIFTLAVKNPGLAVPGSIGISTSVVLYLILASLTWSVAQYFKIVLVLLALGLFVASVGADQGFRPFECVVDTRGAPGVRPFSDGRECSNVDADGSPRAGYSDCMASGKPGIVYSCEHAGLFDTVSVGGRVRYLGVLDDPNDLALATTMALPFAFALYAVRRTKPRLLFALASAGVVFLEIVFTQSRGGLLALGAVLGTYFVETFGWRRGCLVGSMMIAPALALGGRTGESADESTIERLGCACAGIKMLMAHPFLGVGFSQFQENHFLTAHNAYVLAAGELGLPGMWLFGVLLYLAIKVPASVLRSEAGEDDESRVVRAVSMAILASLAGGAVGIFFLSWTYHYVLWIHLGLSGGLYAVVKRRRRGFACSLTLGEAARIVLGYGVMLAAWGQYIRYKGAWE